jgi:hypothetical protein
MNRSKDHYMVAQCSYCRKDRGDIPIGGFIILPMILGGDIYQMHTYKRALYLKKENRSIISGGAMVTGGVCLMYLQHHIRVISLVQKGIDYSEEDQRHSDRGNIPKESSSKGSNPKMRMDLCH